MPTNCPHCKNVVNINSEPIRGPSKDGTEVWVCLWCDVVVCAHPVILDVETSVPCYIKHIQEKHPEQYSCHSETHRSDRKLSKVMKQTLTMV